MNIGQFWMRVECGPGCWLWKGRKSNKGYGMYGAHNRLAHRCAWEIENEQAIPEGMFLCHHCDNPQCVRPSHMFLGDQKANMQDCSRKGRVRGRALALANGGNR